MSGDKISPISWFSPIVYEFDMHASSSIRMNADRASQPMQDHIMDNRQGARSMKMIIGEVSDLGRYFSRSMFLFVLVPSMMIIIMILFFVLLVEKL